MRPFTLIAAAALTLVITPFALSNSGAAVAQERRQSSWGNLEWFELEVAPFVLRFSVLPGRPIYFSKDPRDKEHGFTWVMPREGATAASVVSSLDALVKQHRLMESTPSEPEKTLRGDFVDTPSDHLRTGYGTDGQGRNKRWQSYYSADRLPPEVKAFIDACRSLGQSIRQSPGTALSQKEFLRLMTGKDVAKVKVTAAGDIYQNGKRVSLAQLGVELKRLKRVGGSVLYHRESPEEERGEAASVARVVMQSMTAVNLRAVTIPGEYQRGRTEPSGA